MRVTSLKSVNGFSLIEMVVVIAIAAIVVGIAVPGFTALVRANRAEVQASSLINAVNFARAEAVKRAANVRIDPLVAGSWQSGWRVWIDSDADAAYTAGGDDLELQVYPAFTGSATLTNTATALIFDKFGGAIDVTTGKSLAAGKTIDLAYSVDTFCNLDRNISINHLGRATISHRTDCK